MKPISRHFVTIAIATDTSLSTTSFFGMRVGAFALKCIAQGKRNATVFFFVFWVMGSIQRGSVVPTSIDLLCGVPNQEVVNVTGFRTSLSTIRSSAIDIIEKVGILCETLSSGVRRLHVRQRAVLVLVVLCLHQGIHESR